MRRASKDTPDLLSVLESGAAALNNARVVREAQRVDHQLDSSFAVDWRQTVRPRLAFAGALLVFWALGITAGLVYLQVFQYEALIARAESQQEGLEKWRVEAAREAFGAPVAATSA